MKVLCKGDAMQIDTDGEPVYELAKSHVELKLGALVGSDAEHKLLVVFTETADGPQVILTIGRFNDTVIRPYWWTHTGMGHKDQLKKFLKAMKFDRAILDKEFPD